MADERKAGDGPDRQKLLSLLIPAGGLALIIVLVAVVLALSESSPNPSDKGKGGNAGGDSGPPVDVTKLSDGSKPTTDDPNLLSIGDQGLQYRDLKVGEGKTVAIGGRVKVQYTGWLTNGTVFDSNRRRNEPLEANLDPKAETHGVITGWQQGIPGMKVGGVRKLVIPPGLAYGPRARGEIPANSTLIFEVEVIDTK